jgi:excisionase family DNA binding protein
MVEMCTELDINSNSKLFFDIKWMTSNEAAAFLRVSVPQLRNMVWRRQVHAYKLRNRLRFRSADLEKLLQDSRRSYGSY